ncbi:MAG TPA: efflux RND transporter periplasmic adaptor subunit, partial [Herbaspirillum sp.]|nr:efflux RND transporter periplasmic adaptor subunit [Herbaspirillum sp.]
MFGAIIAGSTVAPAPAHAAEQAQLIRISNTQWQQSGIQTALALAEIAPAPVTGLTRGSSSGNDNDQYLSGTVVAPTSAVAMVSSVVGGVVQHIEVSSLQQVRAGSAVATLFSQPWVEMQRTYLQQAIQARLADEKLMRDESLFKDGIIARSRLEETRGNAMQADVAAKEQYQALRAAGLGDAAIHRLVATQALSPYLTVSADAAGTVLELPINVGQRIEAGMPIAKIGREQALWIDLQASREQAAQMHIGDLLQIKDCNSARVIAISPQINGLNQSTLIRAQQVAADSCLKLNQFVQARLIGRTVVAGSVAVPTAALVRNGADSFVFVKRAQGFEAVQVTAVAAGGDMVWINGKSKGKLAVGSPVAIRGITAL